MGDSLSYHLSSLDLGLFPHKTDDDKDDDDDINYDADNDALKFSVL